MREINDLVKIAAKNSMKSSRSRIAAIHKTLAGKSKCPDLNVLVRKKIQSFIEFTLPSLNAGSIAAHHLIN